MAECTTRPQYQDKKELEAKTERHIIILVENTTKVAKPTPLTLLYIPSTARTTRSITSKALRVRSLTSLSTRPHQQHPTPSLCHPHRTRQDASACSRSQLARELDDRAQRSTARFRERVDQRASQKAARLHVRKDKQPACRCAWPF
jgi:hypothetical protein